MAGWNTIILLKGEAVLTSSEMKFFDKGDTIWGNNAEPKEVNRWRAEDEEEAKKVLSEKCSEYSKGIHDTYITEYALMYCDCDNDGEYVDGADYDLAEE